MQQHWQTHTPPASFKFFLILSTVRIHKTCATASPPQQRRGNTQVSTDRSWSTPWPFFVLEGWVTANFNHTSHFTNKLMQQTFCRSKPIQLQVLRDLNVVCAHPNRHLRAQKERLYCDGSPRGGALVHECAVCEQL